MFRNLFYKGLLSITAIFTFSGCVTLPYSDAPLATQYETKKQKKLTAASHWMTISKDVTESLVTRINENSNIYVEETEIETDFSRAFNNLLITNLVDKNMDVKYCPKKLDCRNYNISRNDVHIKVDVQTIRFDKDRARYTRTGFAPSLLAGGIVALRNTTLKTADYAAGVLLYDIFRWFDSEYAELPTPSHEIIVTVSAVNNNRYIARYSNIYYISDTNTNLYQDNYFNIVGE